MQSDNILENVKVRGVQLMKGLNDLKKKFPHGIKDVRAWGAETTCQGADTTSLISVATARASRAHIFASVKRKRREHTHQRDLIGVYRMRQRQCFSCMHTHCFGSLAPFSSVVI